MLSRNRFLVTLAATAFLAACASKPTAMPSISSSANATNEIANTERMINEARDQQVDVLSPENFTDAEKSLAKAKKMKDKEKSNDKILAELAISQGWLQDAKNKADVSRTSMKSITTARADATRAGAPQVLPKEWKAADKELEKITAKIEKGDLTRADKEGNEITARYKELEILAVQRANLGIANDNIQNAKKDGADKRAPKSFALANMKYDNANKLIIADPKNSEAIRRASEDATRESVRLLDVTKKVNAGNSEDLVLMAERQQRTISGLRTEYSSTEQALSQTEKELSVTAQEKQALQGKAEQTAAELQKTQEALKTADSIRKQFKPNEAEVFVEGGKITVRLKALQFQSAKANLGPKNQAFLKRVETALIDVDPSKVTVEGHTDATGDAQKNATLSEQRAQTVEKYLSANLKETELNAVGMGSDKPISDNNTARGRAENRRIDLVIETQ